MTIALARLAHPGPRAPDRRQAVGATLLPVAGTLRAGRTMMEEVGHLFADAGCRGGMLDLDGVACEPMRFVLPAYARDAAHAAFYSETHAPAGRVEINAATASVGWRDGAPFLHCHGRFGSAMGHLLPSETRLAADAPVRGVGAPDAWFEAVPDAETNFTLFGAAGGGGTDGLLVRLRPDEDPAVALAALAAEHRIPRARVHGLGSIVEPRFADGRHVRCIATEVRIDAGRIDGGDVLLDVSLVDVEGAVHSGRLAPGLNPVGVTFELLVEALP